MPKESDSRSELVPGFLFFLIMAIYFTVIAIWLLFFRKRSDVVPEALLFLIIACFALWAGFEPLPEVEVTCHRKE